MKRTTVVLSDAQEADLKAITDLLECSKMTAIRRSLALTRMILEWEGDITDQLIIGLQVLTVYEPKETAP